MKVLALVFAVFLFSACLKSNGTNVCVDATPASEDASMIAYCGNNGITATKDTSGMYYQIVSPGIPPMPDVNDSVYVIYSGNYLSGTVFATAGSSPTAATVNNFIDGWVLGLQKIGKGGQIKLIIPSSLAYGCQGYLAIPPNAVLVFNITLVDVKQNP